MEVPIIGRLNYRDYQALIIAIVFLFFEKLLRVVTYLLPSAGVKYFRDESQRLFSMIYKDERTLPVKILQHAESFQELANYWDYPVEEHIVKTKDNYILGVQRIPHGKHPPASFALNPTQQQDPSLETVFKNNGISLSAIRKNPSEIKKNQTKSSSLLQGFSESSPQKKKYIKPVVLLYHGLMTCSELWICNVEYENRLACLLADAGYDVWFGNIRGNKYSMKHTKFDPSEREFWEYSMDEMALYDLPDTIDYILEVTGAPSLAYIGFSQGTAQCFAALSINPTLNNKVNLFIALAPATSPKGLRNPVIDALMKSSPNVIYLFFGRKAVLSMALFWQKVLSPPIFTKIIDLALRFLFGWNCKNISETQKAIAYYHLYSYSSTKSLVHWFQIIGSRKFQMFNDLPPYSYTSTSLGYSCQKFPTLQITTPIAIFYGGRDSLADMSMLLRQIPAPVLVREVMDYEHLDSAMAGFEATPELLDESVSSQFNKSCEKVTPCKWKEDAIKFLLNYLKEHKQEILQQEFRDTTANKVKETLWSGASTNLNENNHIYSAVQCANK
ncbi:2131_t:CDS:2 [Funneliformis geosporum]|uniref:12920_t:CDS:1 n=1 Tax=Funneliformis geosporum TaxID=1117311 RepID=A0A9W4WQ61_9GLOM|nr:12920_t:CDS:2 [Funneliformis geosporum]CAI2183857.1 2131_t:CDS:2 [Funneliformis geosporum]